MNVYVVISRETNNIIAIYGNYSKAVKAWGLEQYYICGYIVY